MITPAKSERSVQFAAAVARVFGIVTVISGALALFGGDTAQGMAGDVVRFVLWFNFLAGFAYVAAGFGLAWRRAWGLWLSVAILAGSAVVLFAIGLHVIRGGVYEMRTVAAMILRTGVWAVIAVVAWRAVRADAV